MNEPRIAVPPMARGRLAAARPPKMISSRISRTGMEKPSALPMLAVTSLLMATSVGTVPPSCAVMPWAARPGGTSSPRMALNVFCRAASSAPDSWSTA